MTETPMGVTPSRREPAQAGDPEPMPSTESAQREPSPEELAVIQRLVAQARDQGVALTGPDGLLKALTKTVVEAALEEEMAEHLGYDKHAVGG